MTEIVEQNPASGAAKRQFDTTLARIPDIGDA